MKNPYLVLKVKNTATAAQIKAAYRKRSKETHPDKGGSNESFNEVKQAYDILKNPARRKFFDEQGITDEAKIEQEVYPQIVELLDTVIATVPNAAESDIVTHILKLIDDKISTANKHVVGLSGNVNDFKKFKGKIKKKSKEDHSDNIFENILDGKIHHNETEIIFWKSEIEKLNKIKDIVNLYKCEIKANPINENRPVARPIGYLKLT